MYGTHHHIKLYINSPSYLFHLQMEDLCEHLSKNLNQAAPSLHQMPSWWSFHTQFLQVTLHGDAKEITAEFSSGFPMYTHASEPQKLHTCVKATMLTASRKNIKSQQTRKPLK